VLQSGIRADCSNTWPGWALNQSWDWYIKIKMNLLKGVSTFKGLFIICTNSLRRRTADLNCALEILIEFQRRIILSLCQIGDYSYRSRNMLIGINGKT
jgi:hypothetical protein